MSIQLQKPDYVVIYVSDMQRSTAFYRDVLGLPVKFTSPGWTEFQTGDIAIALHKSSAGQSTEPSPRPPAGVVQLAFNVDDLTATYEALKEKGVYFSLPPQKQVSGVTLAILHDPDGLGISLQQR